MTDLCSPPSTLDDAGQSACDCDDRAFQVHETPPSLERISNLIHGSPTGKSTYYPKRRTAM